jgi:hypothetical protein
MAKKMKNKNMKSITLLITFFMLAISFTAKAESQSSNIDAPAVAIRDERLTRLFNSAEVVLKNKANVKIIFKKMRGHKVGSTTWKNEEWAYIITVENKSNEIKDFSAELSFYDGDGFKLDDTFILVKGIPEKGKNHTESDNFYISLEHIDKIASAKLTGDGLEQ